MFILRLLLVFSCLGVFSGCASLTSPARSHELDLKTGQSYWFDYDASRRGALMLPKDANDKTAFKVCSEPAPDIAFKTVASFENKLAYEKLTDNAKAEITSDVIKLAERGQMVQFLRESLFRLCELSINAQLDPKIMQETYIKILDIALRLQSDQPFKLDEKKIELEAQLARAKEEKTREAYASLERKLAETTAAKNKLEEDKKKAEDDEDAKEIARLKSELEKKEKEIATQKSEVAVKKVELEKAAGVRIDAESSLKPEQPQAPIDTKPVEPSR